MHKSRRFSQSRVNPDVNLQGSQLDRLGVRACAHSWARCSHSRVITILWLFGKNGMASGTFIYVHNKTRKYVYWHSKFKKKCLQLKEKQEECSVSKAECLSDADRHISSQLLAMFLFSVSEA